jgi:hypothetical protein
MDARGYRQQLGQVIGSTLLRVMLPPGVKSKSNAGR